MQPKSSDPPSTVPKKDETWVGDRRDRRAGPDEALEVESELQSAARVTENPPPDASIENPISIVTALGQVVAQPEDLAGAAQAEAAPTEPAERAPATNGASPHEEKAPHGPKALDEPKALSDEPKALSDEPKALSDEPKALSDEPKTLSDEPKALSDEPKAPSDEPKALDEPEEPKPSPETSAEPVSSHETAGTALAVPAEPSAERTWQTGETRDSAGPGRTSDEYTVPLITPRSRRTPDFEEESPPPASASGAHEFEPGRVVDGRYQIEALLGTGAVGLVYRCRHLVLDKTFAIKVLRPDFARDAEVSARLVNEAKAASAIGSPHIVETVDFGRLSDGSAFFVMEFLDGVPLTALIEGRESLTAEDVLHIGEQMAEALAEAHAAGIVHRDLKPDNVFIVTRRDDRRFVKILDFGIAKLARAERKLTRAGQIYGTPHYMSPEQAAGRGTDARTDVYATGIILYEMVTGRVPFDAEEPMGILIQHLNDDPPDVAEVRAERSPIVPGIEVVLRKCLAKDAAHRYQSMSELGADLKRLQEGHVPPSSRRLGPPPPKPVSASLPPPSAKPEPSRAHRGIQVLAALGILVSAVLGYALYTKQNVVEIIRIREPATPPSAPAAPVAAAAPVVRAPPAPVEDPRGRAVMIVVIPPDALIYRGKENLGTMPVTVYVPKGEKVRLDIRAHKFIPRSLSVDGSKPKVVVGLVPKSKFRGAKGQLDEAEADKAAEEMVGKEALPVVAPKGEAAPAVLAGEAPKDEAQKGEAAPKPEAPEQPAPIAGSASAKPAETAETTAGPRAKSEGTE